MIDKLNKIIALAVEDGINAKAQIRKLALELKQEIESEKEENDDN